MAKRNESSAGYVEQFSAAAAHLPGANADWLKAVRGGAIDRFAEQGFPTTRNEAWKYTNLSRMTRTVFGPSAAASKVTQADIAPHLFDGEAVHRMVFVNGRYAPALSDLGDLPEKAALAPLSQVLEDYPSRVEAILAQVPAAEGAALTDLNTAFMADGFVLVLAKGAVFEAPLHIVHYADPGAEHGAAHIRNLIVFEPDCEAEIVETYSGRDGAYWTNAVTQIALGENSRLRHLKLQRETGEAFHTASVAVGLGRDARYDGFFYADGAGLARNDVRVSIDGTGGDCRLNGISLLRGKQHVDNTTEVDHRVPHGTSGQVFRNVLDGQARSVFQGRIVVRQDAQKTAADQQNRNLLLSDRAQADTKPELQIFADDVKCSHGATVGELDRDAMFYLLSRGVSPDLARGILVQAFVAEVIDGIGDPAVRDHLLAALAQWLGAEPGRELAA